MSDESGRIFTAVALGYWLRSRDATSAQEGAELAIKANPPVKIVNQRILEVRGERVILDSLVAEAFGTETKRVNEAIARNPAKFSEQHCFRLSDSEWTSLRSQTATSKKGRGGARYAPHVFTIKGVARLATVLDTDAALRATDAIIDTFVMVYEQASAGARSVAIANPSTYVAREDEQTALLAFRKNLYRSLNRLLDTVVDPDSEQTLRDMSQQIGSTALRNVQERLRQKGLENAKLEADTALVLAETEKLLAEARKTNSEAAILHMDVVERRIDLVRNLIEMSRELEPVELIRVLDSFDSEADVPLIDTTAPSSSGKGKRK